MNYLEIFVLKIVEIISVAIFMSMLVFAREDSFFKFKNMLLLLGSFIFLVVYYLSINRANTYSNYLFFGTKYKIESSSDFGEHVLIEKIGSEEKIRGQIRCGQRVILNCLSEIRKKIDHDQTDLDLAQD